MGDWNEENAKHKAARRAPAPDARIPNKPKKKPSRPFEVWRHSWRITRYVVGSDGTRTLKPWTVKPYKVAAFATREQAQGYIDKLSRGAYVSDRHVSPGTPVPERVLVEEQQKLRDKYFIKEKP